MDKKVHFLDLVKFLIQLHISYFVRIELFLDTVKILKARYFLSISSKRKSSKFSFFHMHVTLILLM